MRCLHETSPSTWLLLFVSTGVFLRGLQLDLRSLVLKTNSVVKNTTCLVKALTFHFYCFCCFRVPSGNSSCITVMNWVPLSKAASTNLKNWSNSPFPRHLRPSWRCKYRSQDSVYIWGCLRTRLTEGPHGIVVSTFKPVKLYCKSDIVVYIGIVSQKYHRKTERVFAIMYHISYYYRENFKIMFDPSDAKSTVFHLLQEACIELMKISFTLKSNEGSQLGHRYVYYRMLWSE